MPDSAVKAMEQRRRDTTSMQLQLLHKRKASKGSDDHEIFISLPNATSTSIMERGAIDNQDEKGKSVWYVFSIYESEHMMIPMVVSSRKRHY